MSQFFCQFCIKACQSNLVGFTCYLCKTEFIGYPIPYAYTMDDNYHLYYDIKTKTVTVSNYSSFFGVSIKPPICSIILDKPLNLYNKKDIIQKVESLKAFQ